MTKPFLILQTGSNLPGLVKRRGDFPHFFRLAMRVPTHALRVCDVRVRAHEVLPDLDARNFVGVVITGSANMVTERLPWSEQTAAWLRQTHDLAVPMLGVCYGHQLLAHAFGGVVDYHPQGREIGTHRIDVHAAAQHDALFKRVTIKRDASGFFAHTTHLQSVLKPPINAVVLARSSHDACQAFRIGHHTWGTQFHPEFSTRTMREYIHARSDAMTQEGLSPSAAKQSVRPTPTARQILQDFVRYCTARAL